MLNRPWTTLLYVECFHMKNKWVSPMIDSTLNLAPLMYMYLPSMYDACFYSLTKQHYMCNHYCTIEAVRPIAALLSDLDQGPFRLLIIDSIICKNCTALYPHHTCTVQYVALFYVCILMYVVMEHTVHMNMNTNACTVTYVALFRVDFTGRGELADRQQKVPNA